MIQARKNRSLKKHQVMSLQMQGKVKKISQPQKAAKAPEFVDTDSDDTDDEQGPTVKQSQKAPKTPEFVDTDSSDDSDNEQEPTVKHPQKVPKTPEFADTDSSNDSDDDQEPTPKQPQKVSKISDPQEAFLPSVIPAKIPNFTAASCVCFLTKGVRRGKQCRSRASDKTGFCHHHKQT